MKKRLFSLFVAIVAALSLFAGCSAKVQSVNMLDGIQRSAVPVMNSFTQGESRAVHSFGTQLLQQSFSKEESVVISPLSVLYALAMTANGAEGETLRQMEEVFGIDIASLNSYLYSTVSVLPTDENNLFGTANSVWVKDDKNKFIVKEEFLQSVKDYYDAGVFMAPFDDTTLKDINNWVMQQTNGQIQDVLDKIDKDAVMYLVNAIKFEALWHNDYNEHQVRQGVFNAADGTQQNIDLMYSSEYSYIEDDNTTGFIKYYRDHKYAFVAMLPQEGTAMEDYVNSLTGEKLSGLVDNVQQVQVNCALPKFETTFDTELSQSLKAMGMPYAFDANMADFSRMGTPQIAGENLFINRVIHKAYIRVAEQGTQAGAATVVEMVAESAAEGPAEVKEVILDRPFVYMIVDTQNKLPLFIGAVNKI